MNGNLVLSRKEGQTVVLLKDGVPLAVVQCSNRDVLVIRAVEELTILRGELLEQEAVA